MAEFKCSGCGRPLMFVCKECGMEVEISPMECDACGGETELTAFMSDEDIEGANKEGE